MQTFLPYPDFEMSVKSLDYRRLGKQRVEAFQILNALRGKPSRWINHPAVKMWRGYEKALASYMNFCIREWIKRGYKNTMKQEEIEGEIVLPPWFGDPAFHLSHRSNLVRKDPEHYGRLWPGVSSSLDYVWPV